MTSLAGTIQNIAEGSIRSIARVLSQVENGTPGSKDILDGLFQLRQGLTIGVTGPPGAGKSTLVNRMISEYRSRGNRVGVIAVDPSSPFSGGALLGDRLRMQSHASDPDVFIRSMGSRGHLGGLSGATRDASVVLTAAGYDPVIIETVGVGQAEVEVAELADITILVLVPGLGDDVQSMKAGIMEIGDVIVLNKADRSGIEQLESYVRASLDLMPPELNRPEVIRTSAVQGQGLEQLWKELDRLACTKATGNGAAKAAIRTLNGIMQEIGLKTAERLLEKEYNGREAVEKLILSGSVSPYAVGKKLLERAERMMEQ